MCCCFVRLILSDILGVCTCFFCFFFFFKQKTAYEMRISDWSSDVCSSDLLLKRRNLVIVETKRQQARIVERRAKKRVVPALAAPLLIAQLRITMAQLVKHHLLARAHHVCAQRFAIQRRPLIARRQHQFAELLASRAPSPHVSGQRQDRKSTRLNSSH